MRGHRLYLPYTRKTRRSFLVGDDTNVQSNYELLGGNTEEHPAAGPWAGRNADRGSR